MFGLFENKQGEVLHHWYSLVENFQTSSQDFYAAVEKALQDRKVPGLTVARVNFAEGGVLSAKREYLRLTRERLIFDICAAPFGSSFFFSSRYAELPLMVNPLEVLIMLIGICVVFWLFIKLFGFFLGIVVMLAALGFSIWFMRSAVALGLNDVDATLLKTPVIGPIYEKLFRKETYYREDTRLMYLETVPAVVKGIAEEITAAKGIKLLKQHERKPILGELYQPVVTKLKQISATP